MAVKRLHLVLLAGGTGTRAAGERGAPPKQFCLTGKGPLFTVSLRSFLDLGPGSGFRVGGVTLAVGEAWRRNAEQGLIEACAECRSVPWQLAPAGNTRTASTWNALRVLAEGYDGGAAGAAPEPGELVAVHDAARPFATVDLLARLAAEADVSGGAVPGVAVPDTIVRLDAASPHPQTAAYLERECLFAVQTPQVFRWLPLHAAHAEAAATGAEFTDDGGLLAVAGNPPVVVPGETGNWKVTTEADLRRAVEVLKA